VRPFMF